jgi:hypothetical protein
MKTDSLNCLRHDMTISQAQYTKEIGFNQEICNRYESIFNLVFFSN